MQSEEISHGSPGDKFGQRFTPGLCYSSVGRTSTGKNRNLGKKERESKPHNPSRKDEGSGGSMPAQRKGWKQGKTWDSRKEDEKEGKLRRGC